MPDIVALGELLIDFTTEYIDDNGYPNMSAHPGGAPCNFLAAAAKYGCSTAFIGKVGKDAFGDLLVKTVSAYGIESSKIIRDPGVFTTLAFVTLDQNGDRTFSFSRKPGADTCLNTEECDFELIKSAKLFHFGTLSLTDEPARTATQMAVAYAKKNDILVSTDPNLRLPLWKSEKEAREQMLWAIAHSDIVKLSEEETEFLWGLPVKQAAQKILEEFYASLVFITLGAKGCFFANRCASGKVACPKVSPVDTTGAGDIFGGAAMSRIIKLGRQPDQLTAEELYSVARFACTAASLSTEIYGGMNSCPEFDSVMARLA